MRLTEFQYADGLWILHPIQLNHSNLLVGENSTGKSRTIEAIKMCADFIAQKEVSHSFFNITGEMRCVMKFEDGDTIIVYSFERKNNKIKAERLEQISGNQKKLFIRRSTTSCSLNRQKVNPPVDKLVIHVRRDEQEYPIIEKLIHWAENTFFVPFSSLKNLTMFEVANKKNNLCDYLLSFTPEQKERVILNAKKLHYNITNIKVEKIGEAKLPFVIEEEVKSPLPIFSLSTGMVCAIYILVVLEYLSTHDTPSCILIDDFSEGLDYERSKHLGRLIFDYSSEHNIDLIVSSNDCFLMDEVSTDKWIILSRNGSIVESISQRTYPALFEEFSFTGLNNFTLFSSNYINQYLSKHPSTDE